ncbi:D-xylulose 5-phosphate/D-fructose 6-phosphate phosphoketolase [Mycena indigotica]|uniref:D-xylulose 5-phosphate/D-fructose 6-phosphate phosphoketolase n=1 Tax=Mycena indigotica TaxID=2126181 RepID=A0A8H6T6R4_9AGAR|nr:D-xylulose 5-phosphate/D-fructose 6-phosphate phosphoketolase [Mycena indigotica]KAF7312098.1 D-xylulose 5-phosphate/D-fructose 6-phosphate phosphoketolase [Mycena indigotica]
MPGQILLQANPPADPSLLPDSVLELGVQLGVKDYLPPDELKSLKMFRRAADYIAAAMIFLNHNVLIEREIVPDDIKPRLLGHWGTCPGLVMVYTHVNRLIRKTGIDALYVVGPGHGAPAILSCLWLEDSLSAFYPEHTRDYKGLQKLVAGFSVPGGFPSHINAGTPGAIHEGGELGYALSVAFGAVMDNPDLVVACVVGDGEAETGPTATAWHGFKYIDPAESGAVLPIISVNGFKISERTIYGTMDDKEMTALFTGYGYQVRIIQNVEDLDNDLAASFDWALAEIKKIQSAARNGNPIVKPRWPVLILRTPKGLGGPKTFHGEFIEGSFRSHQVPLPGAKTSPEELAALNEWLKSYHPEELFNSDGVPVPEVLSLVPESAEKRLGQRKESFRAYQPIVVPDWQKLGAEKASQDSCMKAIGRLLRGVVAENPKQFRIFSPDELVSNKLDAVLDESSRNFQWDIESRAQGGRVIEILSEHTCQGMLQGYTLTGRTGLLPSYEAFLGIIQTMMVQYSKFTKMSSEIQWRQPVGSLNYVETSTWTRQEHNGFSHQNPAFIGAVLNLKPAQARVYLPPDANCALSTMAHCLRAKNYVNLIVGSKQPTAVWLSPEEADKHCIAGASVWKFASTDDGVDPDVVLVGVGVEVTFEVIAAAALLRQLVPALRVRVVNVTDLMILSGHGAHPHALSDAAFDALFTRDKPIHFNYHGYPIELQGLLFGRPNLDRVTIEGYREEGTTTSPFDMMLGNCTSRYDVAAAAIRGGALSNPKVAVNAHEHESYVKHLAVKEKDYIYANGKDRDDMFDVPTF